MTDRRTSERSLDRSRWTLASFVPVVVGVTLGGILGLILFGYPPARIVSPADEPGRCGITDPRAEWLAATLDQAGTPPGIEFQADGCGAGLRAWGTPLRPGAREDWLVEVEEAVTGAPMQRAIDIGEARLDELGRQYVELTDELTERENKLEGALDVLARGAEVGPERQGDAAAAGEPRQGQDADDNPATEPKDALALAARVESLTAARLDNLSEQARIRDSLPYARQVRDEADVLGPSSSSFSIALGTILGGLAAVIVQVGLRLLGRSSGRPARPFG